MATDQTVPGATGGSVHVLEVARGLARRGHEVHAVIAADGGPTREEDAGVVGDAQAHVPARALDVRDQRAAGERAA